MNEIERQEVDWLWYPYIPFGKITVLQGDPGEGKTTLILTITALLTNGKPMPECDKSLAPSTVICQTAEDGLGDTIKPRLEQAGADCAKVVVIDETNKELSFLDTRIEQAIKTTGAKMLILDPLQAYLGAYVDMHRANQMRPLFHRLSNIANETGCAIVLIGHLSKACGVKGIHKGIGSVDITAAARSVLVVGREKDNPTVRVMGQTKSSLAPEGKSIAFELDPVGGFRWIGYYDITADEIIYGCGKEPNKVSQAEETLRDILSGGEVKVSDIYSKLSGQGIGKRTVDTAKKNLGIISIKTGGVWFWKLPKKEDCNIAGF